jgi:hypothetical protein
MPGSYYYATPIGAGMSNLAQAISSIPGREAEAGLLAARQRELDAQTELRGGELANQHAQARLHGTQADVSAAELEGLRGLSNSFPLPSAPQSVQMPDGTPAPSLSNAIAGPGAMGTVAGVGAVPGAVSAPIGPSAMANAIVPTPPGFVGPPEPALPLPLGPTPGISSAIVPGGGTGVTPELVNRVAHFAALTKMDPAKLLMMFGGGNVATAPHTADQAVSYLQSGAGEPYAQTIRGGQETIGQRATEAAGSTAQRAAAAGQESRDRLKLGEDRIAAEERMNKERITGQNTRAANSAAARGGAAAKMTPTEEKLLLDGIDQEAGANGYQVTPQQKNDVLGAIRERWRAGQDMFDAAADEMANMTQTTQPADPGGWFGIGAKPEKKGYRAPAGASPSSGAAASTGAGSAATARPSAARMADVRAAPPVPRDKSQLQPEQSYTLASGKQAIYHADGTWTVK